MPSRIPAACGLFAALLLAPAAPATAQGSTQAAMLVQNSPLAGFRYYEGADLWDRMQVGDALELVREPANPHDPNAVRVLWQGQMLGYLPRRENRAVARHMDAGGRVEARIVRLQQHRNPWQRIELAVYVRL
jgi:hypothetical protein